LSRQGLDVRLDERATDVHGFVEPLVQAGLSEYETALAATRPDWRQEWP